MQAVFSKGFASDNPLAKVDSIHLSYRLGLRTFLEARMEPDITSIEHHYAHDDFLARIFEAFKSLGKDPEQLTLEDLAQVDAFHLRGREGTIELAGRIAWQPGWKVLDVGCGIGGSSRYLAHRYGARVTGIDLTHQFIEAAKSLTRLVGMESQLAFQTASALALPFPDQSFDLVWTEHVQMNIEAKRQFYTEISRVLKPGGHFLLHDIFRAGDELPTYPLPWADEPSYSFLAYPEYASAIIESNQMRVTAWEDTTIRTLEWFEKLAEKARQAGRPTLSPALVMGESAKQKMENLRHCLSDGRLAVVQGVAEKRD